MARIGKIARLPRHIRTQLNTSLQEGQEGKKLVHWLNGLPEVKKLLAENSVHRPINEQNLSDWRQGGYEEWLAHQDILAHAVELAAHQTELETVAPGQSAADHLAGAIAFRFSALLAAAGPELDEKSLLQLKSLGRTCQAVVKLRRSEQNAARLKIETERWELARLKILAENEEARDRKLREKLSAPVLAVMKSAERFEKLGCGPMARIGVEYLREIDSCPDLAHFQSKVMAALTPADLERLRAEQAKNPPPTPAQTAKDMYREFTAFLAEEEKRKNRPARSKTRRRARRAQKPARRPSSVRRMESRLQPVRSPNRPAPAPAPRAPGVRPSPGAATPELPQRTAHPDLADSANSAAPAEILAPFPEPPPSATSGPIKPDQP